MAPRAVLWADRFVVEGLAVDRVDAPELQPARLDPWGHVPDEPEVLPLIEAAHGCRENHDRGALVSEDEKLHVMPERGAPPLSIVPVHRPPLARPRASSMSRQAESASCQPLTSAFLLRSSSL